MRLLVTTLVICAALAWAGGDGVADGRDVAGGDARVGVPDRSVASLSRSALEHIARYRGPRGVLRGVIRPGTAREDFSRVTRFDLETHARRYASPPR